MRKTLLLLCTALLTAFAASAYDFSAINSDGVEIYYSFNKSSSSTDGTVAVTHKNRQKNLYSGNVVIPESVTYDGKDYKVTVIDWGAFFSSQDLESVELPNSITKIDEYAFAYCPKLTSMYLPQSLTDLGAGVFFSCPNIASFKGKFATADGRCLIFDDTLLAFAPAGCSSYNIPETVTAIGSYTFASSELVSVNIPNSVTIIGNNAFVNSDKLEKVIIPNSVTSISGFAFKSCDNLSSVIIPDSVFFFGKGIFCDCPNLAYFDSKYATEDGRCLIVLDELLAFAPCGLTTYDIPSTVKTIGSYAFAYCGLSSINIPDSVTKIKDGAFSDCKNLEAAIIPNSVTSIGDRAFRYCYNLFYLVIPNSVTFIDEYTFSNCSNLAYVTIPNSVTKIGEGAFNECYSLWGVSIPASVTSIGDSAFSLCKDLDSVTINSQDPSDISLGSQVFYNVPLADAALYVPKGCAGSYKVAENWQDFGSCEECHYDFAAANSDDVMIYYTINSDGKNVTVCNEDDDAMSYSSVVALPSSVTYNSSTYNVTAIDQKAFLACYDLLEVCIPNSVTSIADAAFIFCHLLREVTLPQGITEIGPQWFRECFNLQKVAIPSSVTAIGEEAFFSCAKLQEAPIPDGLKSFGTLAFGGCGALERMVVPAGVTEIASSAFLACQGLKSMVARNEDPMNINLGYDVFQDIDYANCTLYVPEGSAERYASAPQWENFTVREEYGAGIEQLNPGNTGANNTPVYDLTGRQVTDPLPGIYIRKGRKILIQN